MKSCDTTLTRFCSSFAGRLDAPVLARVSCRCASNTGERKKKRRRRRWGHEHTAGEEEEEEEDGSPLA